MPSSLPDFFDAPWSCPAARIGTEPLALLLFWSLSDPTGTGKTHLAVAVTRALIDRGVSAVIANVPMLLLTFRGTFSGDRPERFDRMPVEI